MLWHNSSKDLESFPLDKLIHIETYLLNKSSPVMTTESWTPRFLPYPRSNCLMGPKKRSSNITKRDIRPSSRNPSAMAQWGCFSHNITRRFWRLSTWILVTPPDLKFFHSVLSFDREEADTEPSESGFQWWKTLQRSSRGWLTQSLRLVYEWRRDTGTQGFRISP